MITKIHHYPETKIRPWPILARINRFNAFISLLIFIKFNQNETLVIRLILIGMRRIIWWLNYSKEFNHRGEAGSFNIENCIKNSIILFISSEILFFASFFWAYYHFISGPLIETGVVWPPVGLTTFDYLNVPIINTIILLTSGVTVTIRHIIILEENLKVASINLLTTFMLGLTFTYLQFIEYKTSFFSISDSTFGSTFFMLTGFHGIHVILGFLFLLTVLKRMTNLYGSKKRFLRFELASWYWHFVDVVWIKVYFLLYYINS